MQTCEYALKKNPNLGVVLEVFDCDIDKRALVGPVGIAKEVAEKVYREYQNFGLMVDLSHLPLLRETPKESILPIKDYIRHIHIGNAVLKQNHHAYGDVHPHFGID